MAALAAAVVGITLIPALVFADDVKIDKAHFPDEGFRTYMSQKIDTNKNGVLESSEAAAVMGINVGSNGDFCGEVSDLMGLAYFPKLTHLHCFGQNLQSIDVSQNPSLYQLDVQANRLTELDVSKNQRLQYLNCIGNQLKTLDVSQNTALRSIQCDRNQLTSVKVNPDGQLSTFYCNGNPNLKLNLEDMPNLKDLECSDCQRTSLDFSKNPELHAVSAKKLAKLKAKKKYYVRIRSYKEWKGKTYLSRWSKVKAKKTK